jgi:3-deoxy-D-manno-octulosonic-acid transferase
LEALRRRHPTLQIAYTYFSPSAEAFANTLRDQRLADFADVLAWDTPRQTEGVLDALVPSVLIFAKLDVWPLLVEAAARRHTRLGMISATLSATSTRRSRWGVALLSAAYARLDAVGAIAAADADRLRALGVQASALRITGDTRYDQVWARAHSVDRSSPPVSPLMDAGRPTIVAGSTWPSDELVVLDGWWALRDRMPRVRLVLAPHEPTAAHLASVERWASQHDCRCSRLGGAQVSTADLVLIDRVGVLGALYAVADVAFVGGGFHSAGLHSVIEPAAFGTPVLFGPRHTASPDAQRLLDRGAARAVGDRDEFTEAAASWLANDADRRLAGDRAREVVEAGRGATERSVAMIEELLLGAPPR